MPNLNVTSRTPASAHPKSAASFGTGRLLGLVASVSPRGGAALGGREMCGGELQCSKGGKTCEPAGGLNWKDPINLTGCIGERTGGKFPEIWLQRLRGKLHANSNLLSKTNHEEAKTASECPCTALPKQISRLSGPGWPWVVLGSLKRPWETLDGVGCFWVVLGGLGRPWRA